MSAVAETQNEQLITRTDKDGVATVMLNRPKKFNALSMAVLDALLEEFTRIGDDKSVRCVVMAGEGKAFCAGHDLKEMRADTSRLAMQALFGKCSQVMQKITSIPQPVIARIHGIATAAGCQLVATCDLAVAVEEARFATSGINVGLFCSTPMVALTRNMPAKQAFEMLVTGDFIDAQTALQYGLINKVVTADKLDETVMEMALKIASKPAVSIAFGKQLFYKQIEAAKQVAYDMAGDTMTCNMLTEDAQAGVDAFIAKQPMPEWKGK
ncbi:putative enoyl-CoA hydratase [Candidatus Terasakiella magnetica]|uniref:Enoyl-CoA hydratase domain-containing protein 3, mitochondrial n=1 Tax=Candidatus Terasakiella magnetica TaxID=1867952 RepID=A0A1C3REV3_9PROT|nr:enoyl-CoA hydratase [Candidatus Terasakiella magnetica]SCA55762.1 putative enoyl-CoA hydratase [Candidatus Terasakiella magnetica]